MFKRIKIIINNDLIALFRNNRFKIILFSFYVIISMALFLSYQDYKNDSKNTLNLQEKLRSTWVNQNKKDPHSAGHLGTFALKEVNPFSIINKGLYPYLGQIIKIETHRQNAPNVKENENTNYLSRQGGLTLEFILQIFIPLFIIIIAYDSITKEKEQETIWLAFCQGVTSKEIIISKFLSTLIVLAILVIPFFILMSILIGINSNTDNYGLALLIFFLSYMIYFIIFIGISVGVSARCSTSRKSLVWLFSIWVVMLIVIPKISIFYAEKFNPTGSSYNFTEEIEKEYYSLSYKSITKTRNTRKRLMEELLKEYKVSTLDSIPFNFFGYFLQFTESQGTKVYNKSYGKIDSIFKSQNKVHMQLACFSPLTNIRSISMAISSTNFQEQHNFTKNAEKYRQNMMSILNKDLMYNGGKGMYLGDEKLWEKVPEYKYLKRNLKQKINDCNINIVLLIIWCIISFFFFRSSTKYIK